MSDLNLNWVKQNFDENNFVFFDVGCMDMRDSVQVKMTMPKAKVYAFECSTELLVNNLNVSVEYGVHYFHTAVCHVDGVIDFNPSLTQYGHHHPDSGTIFGLNPEQPAGKVYGKSYLVRSVRLETFCDKLNVTPDFIHIDVEGAEYKVFENIGKHKPKCVWSEVNTFEHYTTGTSRQKYDELMYSLGYEKIFDSERDSLYKLKEFDVTPYTG